MRALGQQGIATFKKKKNVNNTKKQEKKKKPQAMFECRIDNVWTYICLFICKDGLY